MKKYLFSIIIAGCSYAANAQEIDLSVAGIPDSLKKNADAVARLDKSVFQVHDIDRGTLKNREITTILSQNGRDRLVFQEYSSKFIKLADLEIKVYDAAGKLINKYKKKDLQVFNFGDGLIDDLVRYYLVVPVSSYPVTIEKITETEFRGTLQYPGFTISSPKTSVMESSFTAIVPKTLGLRYRVKNTNLAPVRTEDAKNETYSWSCRNIPALVPEEGVVGGGKSYPQIDIAPNRFKLDNYEGDMTSWKNFGKWYADVVAGTDNLSESKKTFYRNLVKDAASDKEKIKIIYEYLQKNFRYVSIQLGIGGQRPLPAEFTDDKKYGDCKGLSNYVYAVLKSLGIRSHLVIINRSLTDEDLDPNFPINEFNHVVLMAPVAKDSIWMDCTNKTSLFGELDNTTENRSAILVTEQGGVLVKTPESSAKRNLFAMKTLISLNEDGSGKSSTQLIAGGEYRLELLEALDNAKKDDQREYLIRRIGYKQPDDVVIKRTADPQFFVTSIELEIEKMTEFMAGTKMFLAPHIYRFWNSKLPGTEKRERDYYFSMPFLKTDTTIYKLPAGYTIDVLPGGRKIACENAEYSSSFTYNQNEQAIYSITRLELKKHKIIAEQYKSTKEFFDFVVKEEASRIVMKKGDPVKTADQPEKLKAF